MSVWVPVSTSCDSDGGVNILVRGVLLNTCTTMGSLAVLKASTAWSWVALDKSLPLTCGKTYLGRERIIVKQKLERLRPRGSKLKWRTWWCQRIPTLPVLGFFPKECLVRWEWVSRDTDLASNDKPHSGEVLASSRNVFHTVSSPANLACERKEQPPGSEPLSANNS